MATIQTAAPPDPAPAAVRRFNRFYSRVIGGLAKTYLDTPYSLPEARVIHEVATTPGCRAKEIQERLGFDQGHLSRIVSRLERTGIIERQRASEDGRALQLQLTPKGRRFYDDMSARANQEAEALIAHLGTTERLHLFDAMQRIERLLDDQASPATVIIREGRIGDIGWLLHRHAVVYHQDFGYSDVFERYVAAGLPPFLENRDSERDRLWVAERDGIPVGWVAIQHHPERDGWAQLRWFLVETRARGQGIGTALLEQALRFCRHRDYDGVLLRTVNDLQSARRAYEAAGFQLVDEHREPCPWAPWAHEQRWELDLRKPPA